MTRRHGLLLSSFTLLVTHAVGCGGRSSVTDDDSDAGASGRVVHAGSSGSAAGGASGNGTGGSSQRAGGGGDVSRGGAAGGSGATAGGAGTSVGGNAGSAGSLGGAAAGGRSGSAGAAGSSGMSGEAGQGGVAGSAGWMSAGHVCKTAEDCVLVRDCCRCETAPLAQSFRPPCDAACEVDQCTELGIAEGEVQCVSGRCVIARSCDLRRVQCAAAPPMCAPGFVPSVRTEGPVACWGPCLLATQCDGVTDCDVCPTGSVCVSGDVFGSKRTCIVPPPRCGAGSYCECLAPCAAGTCVEVDAEVSCVCLGC